MQIESDEELIAAVRSRLLEIEAKSVVEAEQFYEKLVDGFCRHCGSSTCRGWCQDSVLE